MSRKNITDARRGGRGTLPVGGTPSSGRRTTGRAVTTTGAGTEGGLPRGQGAPGRQGQPPSGYKQPYSVEDGIAGETGGRA